MRKKKSEPALVGRFFLVQEKQNIAYWPVLASLGAEGLMRKARYQRGVSFHFSCYRLATSTFVLSVLVVNHSSHIPQALRFYYYLSSVGNAVCLLAMPFW